MENPIFKAYRNFDDAIMYGVNRGVKAWNWTTGKQKADLANYLLDFGLISHALGACFEPGLTFVVGLQGVYSHVAQLENNKIQSKENKALKDGLKFVSPPICHIQATGFAALSVGCAVGFIQDFGAGQAIVPSTMGLAALSMSLSGYVMRAENLPPRKSVLVQKAKEKLAELVEKYKPVPVPQPAFAPVAIRKDLESIVF